MKGTHTALLFSVALVLFIAGCENTPAGPEVSTKAATAESQVQARPMGETQSDPIEFSAPVHDIAATPEGSILVAENTTIKEIRQRGGIVEVIEVPTVAGSPINGLDAIGRRSFFATSGGLDLAVGAGLWRVSEGIARKVVDIEEFETEHDPDALKGSQWKNLGCEAAAGFSAGPQSNPYHLTRLSGSEALVADAAGNTLLWTKTNGEIDWVAVFEPPADESGDWLVAFPLDEDTDCYVQPVPVSVDVGPDGAYYVGELTGVTSANLAGEPSTGLSRVWRIEPGARGVVCPSDDCREVLSGLTSVIDVVFGPDGKLYVVEFDENGWFAATALGNPAGGTINQCDVETGSCTLVEEADVPLGAITFDKRGSLWVLESPTASPIVRQVVLP